MDISKTYICVSVCVDYIDNGLLILRLCLSRLSRLFGRRSCAGAAMGAECCVAFNFLATIFTKHDDPSFFLSRGFFTPAGRSGVLSGLLVLRIPWPECRIRMKPQSHKRGLPAPRICCNRYSASSVLTPMQSAASWMGWGRKSCRSSSSNRRSTAKRSASISYRLTGK